MKKAINSLLSVLGIAVTEGKAQPLNKEQVYAVYAGKNHKTIDLDKLYQNSFQEITKSIANLAFYGQTYKVIEYPEWYRNSHKDSTITKLKELGFNILYNDEDIILVSWK